MASSSRKALKVEEKKNSNRFCCCCLSFLMLILLVSFAVVVLVWMVFLNEETKDWIVAVFKNTVNDLNDPENEVNDYEFMQCESTKQCCNGLDSICDLAVNKVLFAGVHNAMATREDGFIFVPNHDDKLEDSLKAGYRAINLDIASCNGELKLVHGFCGAGSRDPTTVFTNINKFLTENPSEVILLNLQIDTNGDGEDVTLDRIDDLFGEIDGFKERFYSHTIGEDWPTLQNLIDMDQRIIFGHYNGGESCSQGVCPSGFHDWFDIAVESEFEFENIDEVKDTTESCRITRGDQNVDGFWGINVFVTLPNKSVSRELNSMTFLQNHIEECTLLNLGRDLNVIFVDFWRQGDLPEVVQLHNKGLGADTR